MTLGGKLRSVRNKLFSSLSVRLDALYGKVDEIARDAHRLALLNKEQYVASLLCDLRYADKQRLEGYGEKVFSQFDEDGIIQEIFRRIGTTNKRFVEFGVGTGIENNTVALLLYGWRGLWIDGNETSIATIQSRFGDVLDEGRLQVIQAFITKDNINSLIGGWHQGEIDLLSIDIDGNDFYVLDAIDVIQPRVIVAEYNGKFPPSLPIMQEYNPQHRYGGNDYYGMSLGALERLGRKKGYALVGCNLAGANAFLVRRDLAEGRFHAPFTAENHYQPARYYLWQLYASGMSFTPAWGRYVRAAEDGSCEQIIPDGR